eukprot:1160727-Pelagomonas_calceolata.AAC.12
MALGSLESPRTLFCKIRFNPCSGSHVTNPSLSCTGILAGTIVYCTQGVRYQNLLGSMIMELHDHSSEVEFRRYEDSYKTTKDSLISLRSIFLQGALRCSCSALVQLGACNSVLASTPDP